MRTETRGPISTVNANLPRGKALFHFSLPAVAFLLGDSLASAAILAGTGLAMAASVVGGPRWSLFGIAIRAAARTARLPLGPREAAAPHRFAEALGAAFLTLAGLLLASGQTGLAHVLALGVAALALLNAASGVCLGCDIYVAIQRLKRRVPTQA